MNDTQSLLNSGGGQLAQTGNPQTIGVPSQADSQNNLQSSTGVVLNQTGFKISSVGSAQFKPVTLSASSGSTLPSTPSSYSPILLAFGIVAAAVLLVSLVILAVKKGQR